MTIARCDPHTATVFRARSGERVATVCDLEPMVPTVTVGCDIEQVVVLFKGEVGDPDTYGKVDHVTCRQHIPGHGYCGAQVHLPHDGAIPERCAYGHALPGYGTLVPTAGPV